MSQNYSLTNSELLNRARLIIRYLEDDITIFKNFHANLNHDRWLLLNSMYHQIIGLDTLISKEKNTNNISEIVDQTMTDVKNAYNDIKYWIVKAFRTDEEIRNKFGIGQFAEYRNNRSKMISFLEKFNVEIYNYRKNLLEVGTPLPMLNQFPVLLHRLKTSVSMEGKFNVFHDENVVRSQQLLNSLFEILLEFDAAAEFVFSDKPNKRSMYRIHDSSNRATQENLTKHTHK